MLPDLCLSCQDLLSTWKAHDIVSHVHEQQEQYSENDCCQYCVKLYVKNPACLHQATLAQTDWPHMSAGGQTNPEHLRQIYQAHLMLQLRVQEVGEYNQPDTIMNAARAVCLLFFFASCLWASTSAFLHLFVYDCTQTSSCQEAHWHNHCIVLTPYCADSGLELNRVKIELCIVC